MNNKIEELLADYLEGNLDYSPKKEIENYFLENPEAKMEFEELKTSFDSIKKPAEIEFDAKNDDNFYQLLAEKKKEQKGNSNKAFVSVISIFQNKIFRYAAGLAALLFTFWFGRQSVEKQGNIALSETKNNSKPEIKTVEKIVKVPEIIYETKYVLQKQKAEQINVITEIGNLKKEMQATKDLLITSLLKKESAADRIQAVNYTYDIDRPDNELLKALISTLDTDPNTNVRTAAADAIARFGYDDYVRNALIKSLMKQQDPSLQITIIDLLTKLNERRALPAFKLLADDSGTADEVKQKAEEGTKLLNI